MSTASDVLNTFPFYPIQGIANFREIGGYPSLTATGKAVKKGAVFRSGETTRVTEVGKEAMKKLGITKVFDFRADVEIADFNAPVLQVDGIDVQRIGIPEEWPGPEELAKRLDGFESDTIGSFATMYGKVLNNFAKSFAIVLRFIKDHPNEGCLVHCTAGKDRTGVFSAVLLMLLGVSDKDIAFDYSLTTQGLEPFLPILAARFKDKPVFKDHWAGCLKMGSSEPESMIAVLDSIRTKYGGAEEYLQKEAGLTADEIKAVKEVMLVPV